MAELCLGCHGDTDLAHPDLPDMNDPFCSECIEKLPEALMKACVDEFDYRLCASTGEMIRFTSAKISGAWVHLEGAVQGAYKFPRGVDVRIDSIVWICDAPEGS